MIKASNDLKIWGRGCLYLLPVLLLISGAINAAETGHDKLKVLDYKLGVAIDKVPGLTCMKDKRTASGDRVDRQCVKFVDDRCKGRPVNIGSLGYGENAAKGCFLDTGGGTYLDGVLMSDPRTGASDQPKNGRIPLKNVHFYGTKSSPSLVYMIEYKMAADDLESENSKLHKALIAKYGTPYQIHSGKMEWHADSTELTVGCYYDQSCDLRVSDSVFERRINQEQEEADAKGKRKEAPEPQL